MQMYAKAVSRILIQITGKGLFHCFLFKRLYSNKMHAITQTVLVVIFHKQQKENNRLHVPECFKSAKSNCTATAYIV